MARGNRNPDGTIRVYKEEAVVAPWLKRGLTNVKMLRTASRSCTARPSISTINTRNRRDELIPVIQKYPDLLGIGLPEGTAIIVKGDQFEVTGSWKVAVHDNTRPYQPWEKPYYVLSAGDVYDMKARKIVKFGTGVTPRRTKTDEEGRNAQSARTAAYDPAALWCLEEAGRRMADKGEDSLP